MLSGRHNTISHGFPDYLLWNGTLVTYLRRSDNHVMADTSSARCPQLTPQAASTPKTKCAFSQTRLLALSCGSRSTGNGGPVAGNSAEPGRSVTSKIVAILLRA